MLVDELEPIEEPSPDALSSETEDWNGVAAEESLGLLHDPKIIMELSEDPVRLYLKEIGGIELLHPDHEFWLATRLEADRRIDILTRQHPIARRGQLSSA